MDIESMMWETVVSPQCSPIVLQQWVDAEFTPLVAHSNTDHSKVMTTMSNSAPIQRDSFIPTSTFQYLWFSWFIASQFEHFKASSSRLVQSQPTKRLVETMSTSITGFTIDQIIASILQSTPGGMQQQTMTSMGRQFQSSSWSGTVWKTSIHNILTNSQHRGHAHSSIYFRRAEEISIEFNPVYNGQDPISLNFNELMGPTIGVRNMEDWHRIDTQSSTTLWLDH
eukprot:1210218-Amphidinium_carterae.1